MNRKVLVAYLITGTGMLLRFIYWQTDVFLVGLLGHIAFISGLFMLPSAVNSKKKTEEKQKTGDGF